MAKRRGNGEGSVYRRGDGRVVGEWVDANGKRALRKHYRDSFLRTTIASTGSMMGHGKMAALPLQKRMPSSARRWTVSSRT